MVEHLDEQAERGVPGELREQDVELARVGHLARLLAGYGLTQEDDGALVDVGHGEVGHDLLEGYAGLEHLVEACVHGVQVEHGGIDDCVDRRLGDDEAATGTRPRAGHLLMLDEADRLAEHRGD